jgi:hypothetical protein
MESRKMKVISELTGGFGNQLFAYACAYSCARQNNADLYINTYMSDNGMTRELGITKLNIAYDGRISYLYKRDVVNRAVFNKLRRRKAIGLSTKLVKEPELFVYHPEVLRPAGDVMLCGYYQNEQYFKAYEKDIRRMFTPKAALSAGAGRVIAQIRAHKNTVAVHIRRGDYLANSANLGLPYFRQAMELAERRLGEVTWCFFSDDISWVKENFGSGENFLYLSGQESLSDIEEFFCMRECGHDIISNSSFSWWAAYLNPNPGKLVIAPITGFWKKDFYPEVWVTIATHSENGQ